MLRFVVRRVLLLIPILLGLSILVFVWIRALPGSPAQALLGERATPETIKQINHQYGLDKPVYEQYWKYLEQTAQLKLGTSITTRQTVLTEIGQRFPATAELAVAAAIFSVSIGIPLGFFAAKRHMRAFDQISLAISLLGISIPIFFLALILKYIFAVRLGLLPTVGQISVLINIPHPTNFYLLDALLAGNFGAFWDVIKHLILPAVALGSIPLAIITRITRAAVLDVQNEDYVRTARAKGLPPHTVDSRHVMRNALLPVSTIVGLQVGLLLSGAILTETVFSYPGIGSWLQQAIQDRNYPVIQGGILFVAIIVVFVNLLVDISYALINPRIRLGNDSDVGRAARSGRGHARGRARAACGRRRGAGCAATRARSSASSSSALFILVAIFAPLLAPDDPRAQDLQAIFNGCCPGPSAHHLLGVDDLGRDELSRILYGARLSLLIGDRRRVGRAVDRHRARLDRRLLRRLGRHDPDALRRHHARDPRLPDGDRHRRAARAGPLPGDDRDRRREHPDLHAPLARIGARAT